jgi:hypothetical protein
MGEPFGRSGFTGLHLGNKNNIINTGFIIVNYLATGAPLIVMNI